MARNSAEDDGAQPDALDADDTPERDSAADEFWERVRIDPVEIALAKGVGLTLRAYVPVEEADVVDEDDDEDDAEVDEAETEDEEAADADVKAEESEDDTEDDDVDTEDDEDEDEDEEDEETTEIEAPVAEIEEVAVDEAPRFLTVDGKLLLFASAEDLVAFVKEDTSHDLAELEAWPEVVKGIKTEWVVPAEEDSYELDLVVENLRGGHDVWDHDLLISAGELARDVAFALRLKSVLTALAPGSPIDDLDNALRDSAAGGFGAFFAKRRLRKIGSQQASLAWRSIIGKISAAVDWRK